jgi:hypothetical protein
MGYENNPKFASLMEKNEEGMRRGKRKMHRFVASKERIIEK